MENINNELKFKIEEYAAKNPCQVEWGPNDFNDCKDILKTISEHGINDYIDSLYDINSDYIFDLERYWINDLWEYFKEELLKEWKAIVEDENEGSLEDEIKLYLMENFSPGVDFNMNQLLSYLPDITCLIKMYSNYDCANSMDQLEDDGYLWHVYQGIKAGVKKDDFMYEFHNGCYGGGLLHFGFKCDIQTLIALKENFKKEITIPAGTQFGFHSSSQGASSPFERTTCQAITLKKQYGPTEYDDIDIIADIDQHYSLGEVFGGTDFIKEQTITVS